MEDKMSNSFLTTMVGKGVRAYKSGPEAWHGLLLAVNSDHIVLYNEKDGYIYQRSNHIKNVVADDKANIQIANELTPHDTNESKFEDILSNLIGEEVKINRGPESRKGRLLGVNGDYLALYVEKEGVSYFNLDHVKSFSIKAKEDDKEKESENDRVNKENKEKDNGKMKENQVVSFIDVNSLNRLFKYLKYSYIMINRGPEGVEGILVDVKDNLITLVFQDQVLRVNRNHVKSIREKMNQENSNDNSNQNNNHSIVSAKKKQQDRKRKN
ncbi:hypothetical protein P9E76_16790 [Schinkia azotoformans]|uniref:Spore coat protein n=1 Tax=Schinkia azotoformans LMG 9581 TaxID=1131731 RepID=K6D549_SCHAZ|nr:hypothetical protein [Schinkia azotoformans]EKN63414.1 spore coat protein [Schinkia azotoformans LMG 9581]MEC1638713.1 hypothetical protein [Schinkia azotoformans]MEC1719228.1 hypothetical protein [Schinkia azotoformans]MEC1946678.1 hypothetical protein [Schinkia azotoformans]MED4353297.1 hypothetical protein [Schinkia azotoformans]